MLIMVLFMGSREPCGPIEGPEGARELPNSSSSFFRNADFSGSLIAQSPLRVSMISAGQQFVGLILGELNFNSAAYLASQRFVILALPRPELSGT
jgi:hypothetical protein